LMAERRSIYNQVTELTNRIKQQAKKWGFIPTKYWKVLHTLYPQTGDKVWITVDMVVYNWFSRWF
jgi:hypothetical protein